MTQDERNTIIESGAAIVDDCNREGPYQPIAAAKRIREIKSDEPDYTGCLPRLLNETCDSNPDCCSLCGFKPDPMLGSQPVDHLPGSNDGEDEYWAKNRADDAMCRVPSISASYQCDACEIEYKAHDAPVECIECGAPLGLKISAVPSLALPVKDGGPAA